MPVRVLLGRRSGRILAAVALLAATGLLGVAGPRWLTARRVARARQGLEAVARRPVRRVSFASTIAASGRVECREQTLIECELEALELRSEGRSFVSGGASTILTVVDDGTIVQKGDVLCTLDSSEYEELVRTQVMKVERARATRLEADLKFQVALVALEEFREGSLHQELKEREGQIALLESELQRSADRLAWVDRMADKQYISMAQVATERQARVKTEQQLKLARMSMENFRKFGTPMTIRQFDNDIQMAQLTLTRETKALERQEERLEHYQRMVERCTIRAPHNGIVLHANNLARARGGAASTIEPGLRVRQHQLLFFLPDLTQMDILANLHETIVDRVAAGMPVRVRLEGMSDRPLEGRVVSVARFPNSGDNPFSDVKYYLGVVRLDVAPPGIKPGMTAQVDIFAGRRTDVLAVPAEAVAVESGHDVCYVANAEGLHRRPVTLGDTTREFLEVKTGLDEGDEVVLDPRDVDGLETLVIDEPAHLEAPETPTATHH